MLLAAKNTAVAIVVWVVSVGALSVWLEREFSQGMRAIAEDTAILLGRQMGLVLRDPLLEALLEGSGRDELNEAVAEATERSVVLTSIDVVNADGTVVATDDDTLSHTRVASAKAVLPDNVGARLAKNFRAKDLRHIRVHVPLQRAGELVGYLTISMQHRHLADLYDQFYGSIVSIALAALVLVVGLGVLLQMQLSRLGANLAKAVEGCVDPDAPTDEVKLGMEFSSVRDAAARVGAKLEAARDQAEIARRELNTLASVTRVGLLLLDADGKPAYVTDGVRELFGVTEARALEQAIAECLPDIESAVIELKSRPGLPVSREVALDTCGAKRFQLEIHAFDSQNWRGCLVLIKDRGLVEALYADLRAATRWRGLSALYVGAAHDIRSPLNALTMNVELLQEGLTDASHTTAGNQDWTRLQHYTRVVQEELGQLHHRLEALLSHAVPTTDQSPVSNLAVMLNGLQDLLEPQARALRVRTSFPAVHGGVHVQVPEAQLRQAFLNILVNALEAMPDGGELTVGFGLGAGTMVSVSVRDSGPGIPTSIAAKIFDMHFTTKSTGTGVGLYVVREIVERHGGSLAVASELGQGTTVTVTLPLAPENELARAEQDGDAQL